MNLVLVASAMPEKYVLVNHTGHIIHCHLCHRFNNWIWEHDNGVFLCDHPEVRHLGLRVISTIKVSDVKYHNKAEGVKCLTCQGQGVYELPMARDELGNKLHVHCPRCSGREIF